MLQKARESAEERESYRAWPSRGSSQADGQPYEEPAKGISRDAEEDESPRNGHGDTDEEEDEDYGPVLPVSVAEAQAEQKHSSGPTIPKLQDLQLRKGKPYRNKATHLQYP